VIVNSAAPNGSMNPVTVSGSAGASSAASTSAVRGASVKLELEAISSAGSAARAKRRIGTPRKSVATGYSRAITSSVRDLQISDVTATTTAFVVKV